MGILVGSFLLFLLLTVIYFIPTFVAYNAKKTDLGAIFILNLLLGWTFLGWVISLVWAMTKDTQTPPNYPSSNSMIESERTSIYKSEADIEKEVARRMKESGLE